jgi:uncharacterized protein with WD repeat
MKRYVIQFSDKSYAAPQTRKDNKIRAFQIDNARVFGNKAAAYNSKGWPEDRNVTVSSKAVLVEVSLHTVVDFE